MVMIWVQTNKTIDVKFLSKICVPYLQDQKKKKKLNNITFKLNLIEE